MDNIAFAGCWAKVSGLNIHFKCLGRGNPVILLHGGGNDWHEWEKNLAFIAQEFQVYALDLPGFGLSQPPTEKISPSWSVLFLKNFLDTLEIENTHVIGHSMGAMFAMAFAAQYPEMVKKMVLIDSCGIGNISLKGRILLFVLRNIDQWRGMKKGPEYLVGPIEKWQIIDQLPKIKSPVLIVWGQNDFYLPVTQSRIAKTLIPDSRLEIFPHCGHAPQRKYPARFHDLILQFLTAEN